MKLMNDKARNAISLCLKNIDRLIYDCEYIYDDFSLIKYLSIIAQEEIAKAFILYLYVNNTVSWAEACNVLRDHKSKQLIAYVIDYIMPEFEEWQERYSYENIGKSKNIPKRIIDAVNVFALEKVKRLSGIDWKYENEIIENIVSKIADGKRDIEKQNAIYVSIDENMNITNNPFDVKEEIALKELETAKRMKSVISITDNKITVQIGYEFELIELALKLALDKITVDEYKDKMRIWIHE